MGGIFYIIPRIYKVRIYSRTLVNVQYSMYVIGFLFFFAGFLFTGLTQGTAWLHQGLPVWSVLPGLRPYMALRAVGGVLIVISFILFTYNIIATIIKKKPILAPDSELQLIAAE